MIANYLVVWLVSSNCRLLSMLNTTSAEQPTICSSTTINIQHSNICDFVFWFFWFFAFLLPHACKQFFASFFVGQRERLSGCVFVFVNAQCSQFYYDFDQAMMIFRCGQLRRPMFMHFTQTFNCSIPSPIYSLSFHSDLLRCLYEHSIHCLLISPFILLIQFFHSFVN